MTKKQQKAIERMNKALKGLHNAGIRICGMDRDLLYATNKAIRETDIDDGKSSNGVYAEVAQAVNSGHDETGTFDAECYEDSGGW